MASLTPNKALQYESLFSPVGDDNAKCNTCGKVLVSRDGNISGLWRHLNFNHKEKYNEFEKKKKELEESRKTKRPAQGGDAGPAPKKAKEDFFKNPSDMDRDLDRRFHEALISHMAETCTPFHQYGESFQQLISVANKRIKVHLVEDDHKKGRGGETRNFNNYRLRPGRPLESWRHLRSLNQPAAVLFAIAISREFPIPGIPRISREFPGIPSSNSRPESREWNFSLSFPFPKMGMEFYGIFIPVPVPENWIGIFHLDSRSRKMVIEFAISRSRSRSPKVIPAHG